MFNTAVSVKFLLHFHSNATITMPSMKYVTLDINYTNFQEEVGAWRRRYNLELYNLYIEPDVVIFIKFKRLELAGYTIRAYENRDNKKIFNEKPESKRKVGRLSLIHI